MGSLGQQALADFEAQVTPEGCVDLEQWGAWA